MKFLLAFLIATAGCAASLSARAAPVLSLVPSTLNASVGGNVSVDLTISGLTSVNEIVSGFDLDVFFNPAILQVGSLSTVLTPWGGGSQLLLSQNFVAPGHVEFILSAFLSDAALAGLQGDAFTLSTINFMAFGNGFSNITYGTDLDFERNVVGRNGLSLSPLAVNGTCVAVGTGSCLTNNVPEPTSLGLLAAALGAAGLVTRRRNAARSNRSSATL